MTKKEIEIILESFSYIMDNIQESDYAQENILFISEIGEVIGSIENALDLLRKENWDEKGN